MTLITQRNNMTLEQKQKGVAFLKEAGYFGRYFNMGSQPQQTMLSRKPGATLAAGIPASVSNQVLPGSSLVAGPASEMLQRAVALGGNTGARRSNMEAANTELKGRSLGQNAMHIAGKTAVPMALMGGLAGLGIGAYENYKGHGGFSGWGMEDAKNMLGVGAGVGLGAGALGAFGGAISGGINKIVDQNTSEDSQVRAREMVAKHPYLTSLPFGNIIGAGLA